MNRLETSDNSLAFRSDRLAKRPRQFCMQGGFDYTKSLFGRLKKRDALKTPLYFLPLVFELVAERNELLLEGLVQQHHQQQRYWVRGAGMFGKGLQQIDIR